MLSKEDTMVRLNKERELEDHLLFVLGEYDLTS